MLWEIRKARSRDTEGIVGLARDHDSFLMPYVLNKFVVSNYIDQFTVAEELVYEEPPYYRLGGAVHFINFLVDESSSEDELRAKIDEVTCFLLHVKQVPADIIDLFIRLDKNVAFLGQIVCPAKGTFYQILEELKRQYDELWCWMSVVGPSYKSYERYGFQFEEERTFWNVYKCDYSVFTLGKWVREE